MMTPPLAVLDGGGVYGYVMVHSMIVALMGSAALAFLYFWRKGQLDMDESPKYQMMEDDTEVPGE